MSSPTPAEIQRIVALAIKDLAARYGLACPELGPQTRPLLDVPGLDSLHCVELIVDISVTIAVETGNEVFWDTEGRARTLSQVADCLVSCWHD